MPKNGNQRKQFDLFQVHIGFVSIYYVFKHGSANAIVSVVTLQIGKKEEK